jgi:hypothetical protein
MKDDDLSISGFLATLLSQRNLLWMTLPPRRGNLQMMKHL